MKLSDLIEEVEVVATQGDLEVDIKGLCYDSRRAHRGDAFFALPGRREDGGAYVRAALEAGAVAAVTGGDFATGAQPLVRVREPRLALAQASNRFFGHPSRMMRVVGVTGTNGKTTTTYLLDSIFRAAGLRGGMIGTTGVHFGGVSRALPFTTPEAPELQGLLREMADARIEAVALEVSSHALAQHRSHGLECDVVVFTNLSHDHLDYHGTMKAYLDAKLMLFDGRNGKSAKRTIAVVNLDDPVAREVIAAAKRGRLSVLGVAVEWGKRAQAPFVKVEENVPVADGLNLVIWSSPKFPSPRLEALQYVERFDYPVHLAFLGRYNAANAALAFGAALGMGIEPAVIVRGLESATGVPGRLERVSAGQSFEIVVDYAHTPDALARALAAVREHFVGRVLLVFGCGGDRDRAKRPLMGRIAATAADVAWVTNDNPRGEAPDAIAREIAAGAAGAPLRVQLDRRTAIAEALDQARPGDVVLIAGKGHETTQTIGERVLPFDDREVARELLTAKGRGA